MVAGKWNAHHNTIPSHTASASRLFDPLPHRLPVSGRLRTRSGAGVKAGRRESVWSLGSFGRGGRGCVGRVVLSGLRGGAVILHVVVERSVQKLSGPRILFLPTTVPSAFHVDFASQYIGNEGVAIAPQR